MTAGKVIATITGSAIEIRTFIVIVVISIVHKPTVTRIATATVIAITVARTAIGIGTVIETVIATATVATMASRGIMATMAARGGYGRGQWQGRLSASDQRRIDSYYSRWLKYRATNNRGEILSMQNRMYDVYTHYGIPSNVPFNQVASSGGTYSNRY